MRVLVGCERFGVVRDAFRRRGHDAWSCDLVPDVSGSAYHYYHYQRDVRLVMDYGWDLAIFHPDCTYLTNSAAWAYGDGPYHQKVKPSTLVGEARRKARADAVDFVITLFMAPIARVAVENPIGHLSTVWRKPDQTIQPHQFGDNASKATCLWVRCLPPLIPTKVVEPRLVNGRPRWGNQTDSGQNKLTPSEDRAMQRAATYPGIAEAMADQWGRLNDQKQAAE